MPQINPHGGYDEPIWESGPDNSRGSNGDDVLKFTSPLYDKLETNIPRGLMGFSDLDWPKNCQLFPKHEAVLEYLERYAEDVRHMIHFQTQVRDVHLDGDGRWLVKTQQISQNHTNESEEQTFDAVVVASGHFNVPYVPSVPGIETWNHAYPGRVSHSMFYRRPGNYADKKVIVVGNSASGVDIAGQISTVCKLPLLQSQKSESFLLPDQSPKKVQKPEIVEYISENRQVRFSDGSIEYNIDAVLYCTGYFYSFPFLNSLQPPVVSTGEHVENLYQHIFYRPHPTLAFVALNQKIIPFPIGEAQSAVIARVWAGRLDLPSELEMEGWERATLEETGGGRNFHVLKFPKDADYIDMLHDWAMTTDQEGNGCSELHKRRMSNSTSSHVHESTRLNKNYAGKEPPYWGEREYWTRERFPAIKKAFQSFGEERHSKRTLEDVGFSFEEWKREKVEEAKRLL